MNLVIKPHPVSPLEKSTDVGAYVTTELKIKLE
jgi:hypothetical protein